MKEPSFRARRELLTSYLETGPLLKETAIWRRAFENERGYVDGFPDDLRLTLYCGDCAHDRTFLRQIPRNQEQRRFRGNLHFLEFRCTHCADAPAGLLVFVAQELPEGWDDDAEDKERLCVVGRWPSRRPQIPDGVRQALDRSTRELYEHGLHCERSGFGVGAFAYFRRVVDVMTNELMDRLLRYATELNDTALVVAIEKHRSEQQASKRIEAVKDLLPDNLKPGGMNPLGMLYGALSEGLHAHDDAECLQISLQLRTAIDVLLIQLNAHEAAGLQLKVAADAALKAREKAVAKKVAAEQKKASD